MTGQDLKTIRVKSGLTVKQFYEEKLGYSYYSSAMVYEKYAKVPEEAEKRLKESGLIEKKK